MKGEDAMGTGHELARVNAIGEKVDNADKGGDWGGFLYRNGPSVGTSFFLVFFFRSCFFT